MAKSSKEHFCPSADGAFIAWAERFNVFVQANFLGIGLSGSQSRAACWG